jgi:MFS family permease
MVALLSATATASYLCRVNVSVAGALVMREFGLSQTAMGQVFSAFVFGYALAQVPAGFLADRWGTRRALLGAAWAWVGVTVLIAAVGLGPLGGATASAFTIFLALRFVLGITEAPTFRQRVRARGDRARFCAGAAAAFDGDGAMGLARSARGIGRSGSRGRAHLDRSRARQPRGFIVGDRSS